ncbi:MAG TPA: SH3 domain-containing protein [Geminicoccus sp.]|jgi:SH3-like domain-containing protein|uniref:SH3 domain-containing protein n=1 Tax=Geminicoccus sp. TaxID=2024832 RepID=UPI002E35F6D1|nr:SH3 domain-containing protein [Geminicoccus sp.]HEX2526246.1 SH3 domain-containing protein [Geminicoccus sp.]
MKFFVGAIALLAVLSGAAPLMAQEGQRSTGQPLPRFVSLSANIVNMRTGPGEQHPVLWVYRRIGLPVKVVSEYYQWRKVVDHEGATGWIKSNLLSNRRKLLVIGNGMADIKRNAALEARVVAKVEPGVIGELETCDTAWCLIELGSAEGWILRDRVWGLLEGEKID